MSRVCVFTRTASQDVEAILDRLADLSTVDRSETFLQKLNQVCGKLLAFPGMGRKRYELLPDLRSFPVENYLIFYRPLAEGIEILRVVSGYRDLEQLFEVD
ncbi:MAG: type II toxin-antitoxin system RelE/ParE family toxin [Spirulina sp. SIO3F2]|nr:type II toxin-antitoxin system RelE/ParE family toxin [Spirulina sp. SIO3F2]